MLYYRTRTPGPALADFLCIMLQFMTHERFGLDSNPWSVVRQYGEMCYVLLQISIELKLSNWFSVQLYSIRHPWCYWQCNVSLRWSISYGMKDLEKICIPVIYLWKQTRKQDRETKEALIRILMCMFSNNIEVISCTIFTKIISLFLSKNR